LESWASTLYVGPAFSYYEHLETGYPPYRLADHEWQMAFRQVDLSRLEKFKEDLERARQSPENAYMPVEQMEARFEARQREALRSHPHAPEWTASFRVVHNEPTELKLPTALQAMDLDPALLEQINKAQPRSWDPLAPIKAFLRDSDPYELKQFGFTEEQISTLVEKLREHGHLPSNLSQ
jgi:hypothetical protein